MRLFYTTVPFLLFACTLAHNPENKPSPTHHSNLPVDKIQLPEGFKMEVYAEHVDNARSLCLSPNGILYVGTRSNDKVYALVDRDGDFKAEEKYTIASGLNSPNGVAWKDGSLYVAEINRILRFDNIDNALADPPQPVVVTDEYPSDGMHGWKYIAFGPDGKLYVPVGAPCNICEPENPIYCSITRINPDGSGMEIVQHGIRNTVGFGWHPDTGELWFTDNGRDWLGDDLPACELNRATQDQQHFGYPYCHQGDLSDPKFGHKRPCKDFVPPVQNLGPHVAPLGMEFYQGQQFPKQYHKQVFIAEHGSWNRSKKIGYRISLVTLDDKGQSTGYEPFAEGWLTDNEKVWGRPVDLEHLPDGSLLVSDDYAGAVYRIYHQND